MGNRFVYFLGFLLTCISTSFSQKIMFADTVDVKEEVFGQIVTDAFRNLEDLTSPKVKAILKSQDKVTEDYFNDLSLTKKYTKYLRKIDKGIIDEMGDVKISDNGAHFYLKNSIADYGWKIYYRSSIKSIERLLFDSKRLIDEDIKGFKIRSFNPSWDGSKLLIALASKYSHTSEILILDVNSGAIERTGVSNTRPEEYYGMQWLPSNEAFTYTSLKVVDPKDPAVKLNTSLSLYDLKTKESRVIFGDSIAPMTDIRLFPVTSINSSENKYIIVYIAGPSMFWDSYYTSFDDLNNSSPNWKPLRTKSDKIVYSEDQLIGDSYYYLTYTDLGKSAIAKVDISKLEKEPIILAELEDEIVTSFIKIDESLYFATSKYGVSGYLYNLKGGVTQTIDMPIQPSAINISKGYDKSILITAESPLQSTINYTYEDGYAVENANFYNLGNYPELENFVFKIVEVKGHDGELIPMSIIHKKDLEFNGQNAVFSDSYGAFGSMVDVSFQTHFLSFVALGGVLVRPHIRGGGAKGEVWHTAGKKDRKFNSWKDLISCMDYLVTNKYTNHSKISLFTESGGAIATAMAINKRPDLAGALIIGSGVFNPSRKEEIYKSTGFEEYGTMKDSIEAMGLIAMDPYLNVPKNTNLPSTLVIHGANDDRIYLHEPLKYVAKMQLYNSNDNPILLDIDPKGTHNSVSSYYSYYGRILAFALKETDTNVRF